MKKFTKGTLESIVEDNDQRIPGYKAAGWVESEYEGKTKKPTKREELLETALGDANDSEPKKTGKKAGKGKGKATATDAKVNAAIEAKATAADEGEEIDDGLTKKDGE